MAAPFLALVVVASSMVFLTDALTLNSDGFLNHRPVIGILSIEAFEPITKRYPMVQSYLSTNYVKYIEMGGGRVVPILINRTEEYYKKKISSINGVLFPGGGVTNRTGYIKTAKIIFNLAEEMNKKGTYFPIWGTCLGFEVLSALLANNQSILTPCKAEDVAMALTMTPDFQTSRLFKVLPRDVYYSMVTENVTANYHKQCLTPEKVKSSSLREKINILSVNNDTEGTTFVSTYEAFHAPYYGVQWHPEKNPFEWTPLVHNIPHSPEAIRVAQHFANFFVNEARKNENHFKNISQENEAVIENYSKNLFYLVDLNITMAERYLFNSTED